jgi:hypothetical protein
MAACRSCGASIEWAEWANSRKAVPLDPGVAPKGNLALVGDKVHYFTAEDERLGRDRRISHFVTCPDAAKWRAR